MAMEFIEDPNITLSHVTTELAQRFETCVPVDRLDYHRSGHSIMGAEDCCLLVMRAGGSERQELAAWYTKLFHDIRHYDDITETGFKGVELLERVRTPEPGGRAEDESAVIAEEYLAVRGADKWLVAAVGDGIRATKYGRRANGSIGHTHVLGAHDELVALAASTTDILSPLTKESADDMLRPILLYFVEKYPDLSVFLHESVSALPQKTYKALRNDIFPEFTISQHGFMLHQLNQFQDLAKVVGLTEQKIEQLARYYDHSRFTQVVNASNWEWLQSNTAATAFLRQVVAYP